MGIDLQGENFQAWEKFHLHADGLTVVVGPSNQGKSALVRAFRSLIRNSGNASQVRLGTDGMRISATIDGHTVTMDRPAKGSVTYQVDDLEPFEKLNGAVPKPVEDLGMGELVIGGVTLDPVFAPQFGPQFLLQEGPTSLNTILGAFSSTEKLEAGKKTANSRIAERNAEAKLLARDLRSVEERRSDLLVMASKATTLGARIDDLGAAIEIESDLIESLRFTAEHRQRFEDVTCLLDRMPVPDPFPIERDARLVAGLRRVGEGRSRLDRITRTLAHLPHPDTAEIEALGGTARIARETGSARIRMEAATRSSAAIARTVEQWRSIVALHREIVAIDTLIETRDRMEHSPAKAMLGQIEALDTKLRAAFGDGASLVRAIAVLRDLAAHYAQMKSVSADLDRVNAEFEAAEATLAEVTDAYQGYRQQQAIAAERAKSAPKIAKHGTHTCPKCGAEI